MQLAVQTWISFLGVQREAPTKSQQNTTYAYTYAYTHTRILELAVF
jgi:hypothetical protein